MLTSHPYRDTKSAKWQTKSRKKTLDQYFKHLKLDERRPSYRRDPCQLDLSWLSASKTQSRLSKVVVTEINKNVMKQKLHISQMLYKRKSWIKILHNFLIHGECSIHLTKITSVRKDPCSHEIDAKQRAETGQKSPRILGSLDDDIKEENLF